MKNLQDESDMMHVYEWVDQFNLSRNKKNIARDFSDGVLIAELIKYYAPKLVDLNNYPCASSSKDKMYNWNTLNTKIFKKLGIKIDQKEIENIIACKPLAIENLLKKIYVKVNTLVKISNNIHEKQQDSEEEHNNSEFTNDNKINTISDTEEINDRDKFYKVQLQDRENIIHELKNALELTEMKIKRTEDEKIILNLKLKEYNDLVRKYGLL